VTLTSANALPVESDAHTLERIRDLREGAAAMISEARDLELQLFPTGAPYHACQPLCEFCLLKALGNRP
jgi:hypothetical protein